MIWYPGYKISGEYQIAVTVFFTLSRCFFPRFTDVGGAKKFEGRFVISACRVACGEVDWYKTNLRR